MPQFGTSNFLANPVAFMESNIVIPFGTGLGMEAKDGTIKEMVLKLFPNKIGMKTGTKVDVYCLRQRLGSDPSEASFYAYWCPYQQNQTLSCMLGNGARWMFTDVMDGCTFGVGSYASKGVVRVAHANEGGLGGKMESAGLNMAAARKGQRIAQLVNLGKTLDPTTMTTIDPESYMTDFDGEQVLKSTTWGLHELGKNWTFYTQTYWLNSANGKYFLRENKKQIG